MLVHPQDLVPSVEVVLREESIQQPILSAHTIATPGYSDTDILDCSPN
jgi:hypothetical protein